MSVSRVVDVHRASIAAALADPARTLQHLAPAIMPFWAVQIIVVPVPPLCPFDVAFLLALKRVDPCLFTSLIEEFFVERLDVSACFVQRVGLRYCGACRAPAIEALPPMFHDTPRV